MKSGDTQRLTND